MKAIHHVVSGNLNLDEIIGETDNALNWFPELKDNRLFKNFKINCITIDMYLENCAPEVKRAYFEVYPD